MTRTRKMRIWAIVNILSVLTTIFVVYFLWSYENRYIIKTLDGVEDERTRNSTGFVALIYHVVDFAGMALVAGEGVFRCIFALQSFRKNTEKATHFFLTRGGVGKLVCSGILWLGVSMAFAPLTKWVKGVLASLLLLGGIADFIFCKRISAKTIPPSPFSL